MGINTLVRNEHSPRILPVPETLAVMVGASTESEDESQNNDTTDSDDFETGEPELEFSEELDTEIVDNNDDDQDDGNPYTGIDSFTVDPVLHNQSKSCQLVGRDDDVFEPITKSCRLLSVGYSSSFLFLWI